MGWNDLVFGLVTAGLGSGLTLVVWVAVALSHWRRSKKEPRPSSAELLEFRAWKRVRRHSYGGETLYRDVVHRWNVLERERDEARADAKKLLLKSKRLEERVAQIAAEQCESPLIRVVSSRARPREIARL